MQYVEKRKRGFFGWVFLLLFLGWNALMVYWLVKVLAAAPDMPQAADETAKNIRMAADIFSFGVILTIWALGSVVTGLLAMLTRGSKVIRRY